jgi:DNA-binding FadR family transcriptional regulator
VKTLHQREPGSEVQPAACAGNETILLVVGALESVLSSHAERWARNSLEDKNAAVWDPDYCRRGQGEHDILLRLIAPGDSDAASREARQHLKWTPLYTVDGGAQVEPRTLRQDDF